MEMFKCGVFFLKPLVAFCTNYLNYADNICAFDCASSWGIKKPSGFDRGSQSLSYSASVRMIIILDIVATMGANVCRHQAHPCR